MQTITVRNKAQLIAAFQCAKMPDSERYEDVSTEITLLRKCGESKYLIQGAMGSREDYRGWIRQINKSITAIRRTPAECFK